MDIKSIHPASQNLSLACDTLSLFSIFNCIQDGFAAIDEAEAASRSIGKQQERTIQHDALYYD